jgi:hypothetical protein
MKLGRRTAGALLLVVSFVSGGLVGMALEEALGIDWFEFLDTDRGDRGRSLLGGLGLSGEQRARAKRILERQEDRLEQYWEDRLPEIEGILEESYAEIRAGLDPEQREQFDKRVRKLKGQVPEEMRDD